MANEGNMQDTNVLLSFNKNIHQDARSQMQLHDLKSEYVTLLGGYFLKVLVREQSRKADIYRLVSP